MLGQNFEKMFTEQ